MNRDQRSPLAVWAVCLTAVVSGSLGANALRAGETLKERRARIERMDPAQKAELLRREQQFAALDPAEQQRLCELHDKIEAHLRSEELLEVMERYCEWVKTLTPYERVQLRELPPAERIKKIRQLHEQQDERRKAGLGGIRGFGSGERLRKLASQERGGLVRWLDQYVAGNAAELVEALPEPQREKLVEQLTEAKDDPDRRRSLLAEMWVLRQLVNRGKPQPLDDQALDALRSQLSPAANESLQPMRPDTQQWILGGLIGTFVLIESHAELAEFMQNELKPEECDRLMNLPRDQMQLQLWWLYLRSKWPELAPRLPGHRPGRRWPRGAFESPLGGPPKPPPGLGPGPPRGPSPRKRPPEPAQEGPGRRDGPGA